VLNQAAAMLCPHPGNRVGSPAPLAAGEQRATVYVDGAKGTMGLCLACKAAMERLIARDASLADVMSDLRRLGYGRRDAIEFHAQMRLGPARWWRRLVNPLAARRLPDPRPEVTA